MFNVEMLPACEGDALWITYGTRAQPRHVLIDAGRKSTAPAIEARIKKLPPGRRRIELAVVTHIDRDHIEGMLSVLKNNFYGAEVGDFWFNNYDHLSMAERGVIEAMGGVQGEALSEELVRLGLPWNKAFDKGPVCITGNPVEREIDGGLKLTLLSPTPQKLAELKPQWKRECREAGIAVGGQLEEHEEREAPPPGIERLGFDMDDLASSPFRSDKTKPNGSSITMIAEHQGRRILLGADCHCDTLLDGLNALREDREKLTLHAFKVPHHGSKANISKDVLDAIDCPRYLISTNGSYFDHPDQEAIARIIRFGGPRPKLMFNYRSEETDFWDDAGLIADEKYEVFYPKNKDGILRLAI